MAVALSLGKRLTIRDSRACDPSPDDREDQGKKPYNRSYGSRSQGPVPPVLCAATDGSEVAALGHVIADRTEAAYRRGESLREAS